MTPVAERMDIILRGRHIMVPRKLDFHCRSMVLCNYSQVHITIKRPVFQENPGEIWRIIVLCLEDE